MRPIEMFYVLLLLACTGFPQAIKTSSAKQLPTIAVYNYVTAVTLGWKSENRTKKAESQKQVLFHDSTGHAADLFFDAVRDVNRAFGYDKLVAQLSTTDTPRDQAIVIFLGSRAEGRKFLREAGGPPRIDSSQWSGWFWWDNSSEMNKAAISVYKEELKGGQLAYILRRSLLTALGYPGGTPMSWSFFSTEAERRAIDNADISGRETISDLDRALLRFCDRMLSSDANRSNTRQVISSEWPAFASAFDKATLAFDLNSEQRKLRFTDAAEAQGEALRLYPELGIADSPFNKSFRAKHKMYQKTQPDLFKNPNWPLLLADEVAAALKRP